MILHRPNMLAQVYYVCVFALHYTVMIVMCLYLYCFVRNLQGCDLKTNACLGLVSTCVLKCRGLGMSTFGAQTAQVHTAQSMFFTQTRLFLLRTRLRIP